MINTTNCLILSLLLLCSYVYADTNPDEKAHQAQDMAENCNMARKYLAELQSRVSVRLTELSPEEEEEIAKTQEVIKTNCVCSQDSISKAEVD